MGLMYHYTDRDYVLEIEAIGDEEFCENEFGDKLEKIFKSFRKENGTDPAEISLLLTDTLKCYDYGFRRIDSSYLERFETLKELILPDSITEMEITPKLEQIFKDNNTLIRGSLNSYAEQLATDLGLNFRPSDFIFAKYFFRPAFENTVLTMIFARDGKVVIEEDVSSPGSSAGNTFGGKFYKELPCDFWKEQTAEDVADLFNDRLKKAILEDGRLAAFIEEAQKHKIFTGKN